MIEEGGGEEYVMMEAVPLFEADADDATFLRWLSIAVVLYLLASCKANWCRINMQIMPLVAYTGLNLPSILFNIIRGDFSGWMTFIIVTLHLFIRQYFQDYCGFPVALLFLTVTVPHMLARCLRNNIMGSIISVTIGSYLLHGHIRSRGPSQAFANECYCVNTLAIALLLISPLLEVYQFFNEVWQQSDNG